MRRVLLIVLACLPLTAFGEETPLSAEAFDAYVTGKTISYSSNGLPFGAEDYLDGRRVRWSYLDGDCLEGTWYPQGSMICFVYETIPEPQCWSFFLDRGGLIARFENRPDARPLYEMSERSEPLVCPGPRIGV